MFRCVFQLFDHIAKCLAEFIKKYNLDNKNALPLGFTFSFPLRQVGLTKGYLNSWTKGFNCSGVVNEDVVRLLKEAIRRRKVKNDNNYFYFFLFIIKSNMFKISLP